MAYNFPQNPNNGDTYLDFTYDGTAGLWNRPSQVGPQGPKGDKGDTGASGVISVTGPITNSGTSTSAIIGLNQDALTLDGGTA